MTNKNKTTNKGVKSGNKGNTSKTNKTTTTKDMAKPVNLIEEAIKAVDDTKEQAQVDYNNAMASLVIVRN